MKASIDTIYQEAILFFHQKYQNGHLDVDTAIMIDNAIDALLKSDNIVRNENIPNEEQVVNEDDPIINTEEQEFEIIDADNPDKEEHIEDEDHFDDDDLERNDN